LPYFPVSLLENIHALLLHLEGDNEGQQYDQDLASQIKADNYVDKKFKDSSKKYQHVEMANDAATKGLGWTKRISSCVARQRNSFVLMPRYTTLGY
jgi:hypothetical protein